MSTGSADEAALLEQVSALADGEVDDSTAAAACAAWRRDSTVRASWHAYQLIGDVLRSEDLAADPARDVAFLASVRDRLAREPVVVAPRRAPLRATGDRSGAAARSARAGGRFWRTSAAVAAGFVAVAGVFTVTRSVGPGVPTAPTLARADGAAATTFGSGDPARVAVSLGENPGFPDTASAFTGALIRDARLDAYLAAHKQFAGSSALGVPSAFVPGGSQSAGR